MEKKSVKKGTKKVVRKSKPKKRLSWYWVAAFYGADLYPAMDRTLKTIVGKESDSSGLGFGERENSWIVSGIKEAKRLAKSISSVEGVEASIIPFDES